MKPLKILTILLTLLIGNVKVDGQVREMTREELKDRINGGLLGQFFGNLNGLPHENQYFEEPGNIEEYTPDLSDGAFTDDDTDIEFVYVYHMLKENEILLSYTRIKGLWEANINDYIWCSNRYARDLMSLGIAPPFTGSHLLNPWAGFNISGQFLCEQFGLISPGMPATAARIGTHYTGVAVDGEPVQTTQFFDAVLSMAFFLTEIDDLIEAGLKAVDPESEIHEIVSDVRRWYTEHPDDWRKTRSRIKETYWSGHWGGPGGSNGYRTITAATVGALLHGQGDFVQSLRLAFNFGWDADNISAMVGTIVGLLRGEAWIRSQGWKIKNLYLNNRRTALPAQMTITDFADLHFELAHRIILQNGGKEVDINGSPGYLIPVEAPENVITLQARNNQLTMMQNHWRPLIANDLVSTDTTALSRAVYLAICLQLDKEMALNYPPEWKKALQAFPESAAKLLRDEQWTEDQRRHFQQVFE